MENKKGAVSIQVAGAISVVIALVVILALLLTVTTSVTTANTSLASYSSAQGMVILIPLVFVAGIILFVIRRFLQGWLIPIFSFFLTHRNINHKILLILCQMLN